MMPRKISSLSVGNATGTRIRSDFEDYVSRLGLVTDPNALKFVNRRSNPSFSSWVVFSRVMAVGLLNYESEVNIS